MTQRPASRGKVNATVRLNLPRGDRATINESTWP